MFHSRVDFIVVGLFQVTFWLLQRGKSKIKLESLGPKLSYWNFRTENFILEKTTFHSFNMFILCLLWKHKVVFLYLIHYNPSQPMIGRNIQVFLECDYSLNIDPCCLQEYESVLHPDHPAIHKHSANMLVLKSGSYGISWWTCFLKLLEESILCSFSARSFSVLLTAVCQ